MFATRFATLFISLVLAVVSINAAPAPVSIVEKDVTPNMNELEKRTFTVLSAATVATYKPYSYYAAVPGCGVSALLAWSCTKCKNNPSFTPVAAGGNGDSVQFWYVGYDSALSTIIVSFQGTDASKILPIITDANFFLTPLRTALFPGISSSLETHNGFGDAQAASAAPVLAAVKTALSRFGTKRITVTGHSLGGAIAHISIIHLKANLPAGNTFRLITYGSPRVGNQAFVDYINSNFASTARITNQDDIVPIVPGRFLDFAHVQGEIHIRNDNSWASCPGQDNTDSQCTIGYVPNILAGDTGDHSGPYDGVNMGC